MRFVNDDEIRTMVKEYIAPVVLLDKVDGYDLIGNVSENILVGTQTLFQTAHCGGAYDFSIQSELVLYLILPLLTQVRKANYSKTGNLAPVKQFLGNK